MKLLVAVDGSDHAAKAVETAGRFAAAAQAEVIIVHQRSDEVLVHGPTTPPDEEVDAAQELVDAAVSAALAAGAPSARGRVARGLHNEVAQAILDIALEEDVDVIVVGPRGLGPIQGLVVGSVTNKLVQHADRPVLVVR